MQAFEDIFVILTYKNTDDLPKLLVSIKKVVKDYRIIIVNSFYNEKTVSVFQKIADDHNCDFISVENKGYGYGNNVGINYAREKYEFKRIVISNPDIIIHKYDQKFLDNYSEGLLGGKIINARKQNQNPIRVYDWHFTNYSPYYRYIKHNELLFAMSILFSKIQKVVWNVRRLGADQRTFALHGSFLVLNRSVFDHIDNDFFDQNIFMNEEEIDIGKRMKSINIPLTYTNAICVNHKEDGDIGKTSVNSANMMKKSIQYVREKWSGM